MQSEEAGLIRRMEEYKKRMKEKGSCRRPKQCRIQQHTQMLFLYELLHGRKKLSI